MTRQIRLSLRRQRTITRRFWIAITFLLLLALPMTGRAQQDVGTIGGTVVDPTGSVVPNAKITVTNDATGLKYEATTNENGFYQSQPLPPGTYSVTIGLAGFSTMTTRNVVVDAAAHVTTNAQLQVGTVDSSIVVESTPPALNIVDAQISNTIDTRAVQELPVNGRSVLALATLSPGVVSAAGATNQGFTNRGTQASAIRISGGVPGGNNNLLDGTSNLQNYLGEVAINIKADSVQEFRIMTGVIPAQFGYTSGGVINVVTRSGANQFHGSAYEFFRNDYLDATLALPKTTKPELRFNNYGGTFGGPIIRDKAFFFGNYEEYRFVTGSAINYSVPTVQERGGNFSDLRRVVNGTCTAFKIFDPNTGSATTQRQAFPNNQISASRQDPVSIAAMNLFIPAPNNSVGAYDSCTNANNYLANPKLVSTERTILGRADYRLSDRDSVIARYAYYQNYTNNGSQGFGPLYYRNDTLSNFTAMLAETHIFSPTLVNDLRLSGLRSDFPFQAATANQNYAQKIGLPGVGGDVAPILSISGVPSLNGTVGFRASTTFELLDDLTKTLGAHTMHFGFDGRWVEGFNLQSGNASGSYGFSSNSTAEGSDTVLITTNGNVGSSFATFLAGNVSSASTQLARGIAFRQLQIAGYVQDDWHANQRLTLNLGLRWDFQQQPYEKKNGMGDFDITQVNPVTGYLGAVRFAGLNGEGRNFVHQNWNDWGPRLGFALVLTNDNKTVLRGGYAMYYPTTAQASYDEAAGSSNGFGRITTSYNAATTYGTAFLFKNGVPSPALQPLGSSLGQISFRGQTGYYIVPRARTPQSMQYTLTLSRQLPFKMVMDISYLGNHGRYFNLGTLNINTLDPSYASQGAAYLNALVPNPYAGKVPENSALNGATISRANLLRPYPYMSSVLQSFPRSAHFDGNFMYVTLQRRAAEGLQFQGSYTYGKLMSLPIYTDIATTTGITQTGNGIQNPRNLDGDYSVDAIDVTHRGIVAVLYDLPFGRNRRYLNKGGWMDRLVGGLQFNTTMTLESGRPLNFSGANNSAATRPDLNESLLMQNPTGYTLGKYRRFNYLAFTNPAAYTYGNAPRFYSKLRAPGVVNFDMSVFKTTRITEGTSLELRLEAYNALNHVNLGAPNTSYSGTSVNTNNNMGVITTSYAARTLQLGAKLHF
ncbi:TonB-dependent receptor [Terriglobus albidus]|uniref:TonB-dependent receptor n=1 Tax=Terriglobus albidus TaxID=1592106 RepID=A0A5B9EHI5_9BACT|nr:carboxypeptidase regulatory-like domain-containing protein [Terriglobus albidus]QEE30290.1 TonB-dependent receptor [Terriglobus albidus]